MTKRVQNFGSMTFPKIVTKPSRKIAAAKSVCSAKTMVYVPKVVFEQWRELAFAERKKMHDYLIEGFERVFEDRGLKSISELLRTE